MQLIQKYLLTHTVTHADIFLGGEGITIIIHYREYFFIFLYKHMIKC